MKQTVIGFFDEGADARKAVQKLETIGISRDNIDISNGGERSGISSERDDDSDDRENGITRFFKSLFGGDDEADRYSKVAQNCTVVTVHVQSKDQAERAADLLDDCGAVNVNERAGQDFSNSGYSREGSGRTQETSIPRVEENLEVGKREVETGGVRVRSRIVERPVEEQVRLREENVHVERTAVDRPASDREMNNLRDREIELTERSEVPVVSKEARVVEEVRVSKDVNEREETVRDTVRNTEVDVDKLNPDKRR